jgi:hypothetical protein
VNTELKRTWKEEVMAYLRYGKPSLIRLQLIWMSDNPDSSMKNEKFSSQLRTCFKRHMGFRSKRTCRLCRRQLERLKPRNKISKIGFSWIKETLDFSF